MPLHTIPLDSPATLGAASNALQKGGAGDQVLLVLPREADDLASEVRLQVLRRQADAAQVQVGLVTKDKDIRHFARKARIPAFSSADKAQGRWRYPKPPAPLPPPSLIRPLVINPPREVGRGVKAPAIVTVGGATLLDGRTRQRKDYWWLTWLGYLFLIIVVAALIGGLALLVLPQATVTVIPSRTQFVSSGEISAQVGIDGADYLNDLVPARSVQARVEGSGTIGTTGADDAPVGKATGVVTFINQTNREIAIPQNTIVRTSTGNNIRFRTVSGTTAPAGVGQQVAVGIEAVEPGRQGNVPAFNINEIEGSLNATLRVTNQSSTGGGTVENVAVVVQSDKDRLLGQLQDQLQRQAYTQLAAGLDQGEIIPPETVSTYTLAETYDSFAGEQSDVLGMQLQLLARGLAVDVAAAGALADRSLRESIPTDHYLLEESIRVGEPNFTRFTNESVDFTLTASAETLIPITTGQVRSLLIGAPLEDAESILINNLKLAVPPEITLEPNWLNRLPYIPTRIVVRVLQTQ